ncbi:MAG: AAA family ATPase [Candidatus Sericytochromatia bacterium]
MLKLKDIFQEAEQIKQKLTTVVYGQEESLNSFVDLFVQEMLKPKSEEQRRFFTFIGAEHSGRAFLAKNFASFSKVYPNFKYFNLVQSSPEGLAYLVSPSIEENLEESPLLKFLREKPNTIVHFDNLDKLEPELQDLLIASIFENELFKEAIIILGISAGKSFYLNNEIYNNYNKDKNRYDSYIVKSLESEKILIEGIFHPIFSNRVLSIITQSNIVLFKKTSLTAIAKIALNSLEKTIKAFTENTKTKIILEEAELLTQIASLFFLPNLDTKIIKDKLPKLFFNKLLDFLKNQNDYPTKITFFASDEVKEKIKPFLNEDNLKIIIRKNLYLKLEWEYELKNKNAFLKIKNADFEKVENYETANLEKIPVLEYSDISFEDIPGQVKVKKHLEEIITLLNKPEKVKLFEIDMPKGLLLYGPEGIGKRFLAMAFAKQIDTHFIRLSGSDLFNKLYIHKAYEKAREFAPCVVIIEGLDIKGIMDGVVSNVPSDWFFNEFENNKKHNVFTIATASNKEELDMRLFESGRIELVVEVQELDKEARKAYLNKILKKPNDGKIDIERVAHYVSGMSLLDLARLEKNVALAAIRNNQDFITEDILIEQINIIKYGNKLETTKIKNFEEDMKRTAYHEAGHAVLSMILQPEVIIEQVTIAPRSDSLGFVSYNLDNNLLNMTKEQIINSMYVSMAGRISTIKQFGEKGMESGAVNDLEQATAKAYFAIAQLGMDEELGFVSLSILDEFAQGILKDKIGERLIFWIKESEKKTFELVDQYWSKIEQIALLLIKKEVVENKELTEIIFGKEKVSKKIKKKL